MRHLSLLVVLVAVALGSLAQSGVRQLAFPDVVALKKFLSYSPERIPLVSAHRGGPVKGFPENAIETFAHVAATQPVIIETDIALSKDSVLVMMHDNRLDRTTTGTGLVSDYTYAQLQALFLKDEDGRVTPYKIPTLEQVLEWGKGKVIYTLDVKRGVPFRKVVDAVRKTKAEAASVIITYNVNQAAEVFTLAPDLMLSVSARSAEDLQRLKDKGIPAENMVAFVGTSAPDSSVYAMLHAEKILCVLGTMGNLDKQAATRGDQQYAEYIKNGADILSTDRPMEAGKGLWSLQQGRATSSRRPAPDTIQRVNEKNRNSAAAMQKPYVILISLDGFRHDYVEKFEPAFLAEKSKAGVRAAAMLPSYPTVTFPNHYTIATGLYPAHHGLVNNSIYDNQTNDRYSMSNRENVTDPKWYGGTPIWVLAEQQQTLAANLFWVGSEAPVQDMQSTYWYPFNDRMDADKRIAVVKEWLSLPEERRPHLITFYLSDVDHAGHSYGPDAAETRASVLRVDSILQKLEAAVASTGLPVNYIVVSDHGMTAVDQASPIRTPVAIDTAKFIIASSGTMMVLHAKDPKYIEPLYQQLKKEQSNYTVYKKKDMPGVLHYGAKNDRYQRLGDIMLLPKWPYVFSNRKPGIGHHGFPNTVQDMHAIFIAWGPAFKKGLRIPAFENVHVYPLMQRLLNLNSTEKIDGNSKVLQNIIQ